MPSLAYNYSTDLSLKEEMMRRFVNGAFELLFLAVTAFFIVLANIEAQYVYPELSKSFAWFFPPELYTEFSSIILMIGFLIFWLAISIALSLPIGLIRMLFLQYQYDQIFRDAQERAHVSAILDHIEGMARR